MSVHTVVRRAEVADLHRIKKIRLRALQSDPSAFGSTYQREKAFPKATWLEWVVDEAAGDDLATFLALRGTEPVGMVAAFRDDKEPGLFRVIGMWVAPDARRSGIGRRLLEEVETWVLSRGGSLVRLAVTDAAPGARRLYERAGYQPDGRRVEVVHTPGLFEVGLRKKVAP